MSTTKKVLLIIFLSLLPILLLILGRVFKAYVIYTVPTSAMYPAIKPGQTIFGSCIPKAGKGDIVSYHARPSEFDPSPSDYVCRIVATSGDTVQIKNGNLYLNGTLSDDTLKLAYLFRVSKNESATLNLSIQETMLFPYNNDSVLVNSTYTELTSHGIKNPRRLLSSVHDINPSLFNSEDTVLWNIDNFGPVVIPADHVFLMGDNRSNSADSRFRGFTPANDVIATIFLD